MLEDLETLFWIFYTFVCKKLSPGKSYWQKNGKSKAGLWRNLSSGTPPKVFSTILCFVALVYKLVIFFSEQPFYGNSSTLDSHTNTVISHTFAHSSRWRRKPWQGLLSRDVIGRLSVKPWCYWLWRLMMSLVGFDPSIVTGLNSLLLLLKLSVVQSFSRS